MPSEILICSRRSASKHLRSSRYKMIHSVLSLGSKPASGISIGRHPDNVLRIEFQDTHDVEVGPRTPSKIEVQQVIDFFSEERLGLEGEILVHCHAGVGRSAASGFLGLCLLRGKGREHEALTRMLECSPRADPNPWIIYWGQELLPEYAIISTLDECFEGKYSRFSLQVTESGLS